MPEQDRLDPLATIAPIAAAAEARHGPAGTAGPGVGAIEPIVVRVQGSPAAFTGRTPGKTAAIRAGMLLGTGLVVAIGAAVAMGASPSPTSTSGGAAPAVTSSADPGAGNPGRGPRGGFGPFAGFGPGGGLAPGGLAPGGFGPGGPGTGLGRPGAAGIHGAGQVTVTTISGSSISLATVDGWTRMITVTGSTTVTKGGAVATLADLAVGDVVRFAETRNSDGTFAITKLDIVPPQVAGTVTAVTAAAITLTLRDGTASTIKTNRATTYHVADSDGTRADVTVGVTILATGGRGADGSLTAGSVWVRLPHVGGTVTAVGTSTITVARPDGTTVTVHVGAGATIRVAGVDGAKLSDLKSGMVVVVEGAQRADGSIDARMIGAGKGGRGRDLGNGHGKVQGPDASVAPVASGSTGG